MTKSLKGLSGRSFTTSTTLNETIVTDREAFTALSPEARFISSFAAESAVTASDSFSITIDGITLTKGESGGLGLPCLGGKDLLLHYMSHGGRDPTTDSPLLRGFNDFDAIADEGTLTVVVGGSVSGNIDFTGDTDNINVFLVAGQVYMVSLRGTGANALNDTFLQIRNPSGTLLAGSQGQDDDGGVDLNSVITISTGVTVTGIYQIRAASFANINDPGLGGYTVDVRVRGVDAVGDTNATSVPLSLGTTFGFRESSAISPAQPPIDPLLAGDLDRYSVTLEEGHFYTFKVAASADYTNAGNPFSLPTGTVDTFLYLTNTAGSIVAFNDDNSFPSDLSSSFGFYAAASGTYYLNVTGYSPQTGGYVIDFQDIDYAALDPLDAIIWADAENVDFGVTETAYVYFAPAGESFGELNDAGTGPRESFGWSQYEMDQVMLALEEYEHILGVNYEVTTDVNQATFRLITTTSTEFGAYFYPQDPAFGTQQGIGAFNVDNLGWDPAPGGGLERGGFGFSVILHEFGHAHGLAHPHDTGGSSDVLLGVTGPDSLGIFDLNQSVYTVMSYNDGWETHPDGPVPPGSLPAGARADAGWAATLSAFDIAAIQQRYGVINPHATGDDTYTLKDINDEGTFYTTIWDTGGIDTIEYNGATRNAVIDLTAATIDYSPTGGGVISFVRTLPGETAAQSIKGGFTIAEGVVIENATGGGGNDQLIGNAAANTITGNGGDDDMLGRAGDDTLAGGAGSDTAHYLGDRADYTLGANISGGVITSFTVTDNNALDGDDGTDTLTDVESAEFDDASVNLVGAVAVFDGNGDLVSVHTTIQAAIDDATTLDGYTIFVSAGTYAEDVNVTKGVTIQGANDGTPGTDPGRITETSIDSLTISADGVTVDGVEITGDTAGPLGTTGVVVANGSDNFSLVNSVLSGGGDFAIFVGLVAGLDVGDNLIEGYSIGMYIAGGDTEGSVHDNTFQGEVGPISGLGNGVNSETSHVLIQNNVFDGIYAGSLNIFPFGPDTVDLLDYIIGNTITNSGPDRPVQILPTNLTHHILGTNENEAFDGETAALNGVTGAFSFDGRGGEDRAWGGEEGDTLGGGADADRLFGNGGNDILIGGTGVDLMEGDLGDDSFYVDEAADEATEVAGEGRDIVYATVNYALHAGTSIEILSAASLDGTDPLQLSGNELDQNIYGNAGNNILRGGGGSDLLLGGGGDDEYYITDGGETIFEYASEGRDIIYTSLSHALAAGSHVEILSAISLAGTSNINLIGNELDNYIFGNAGENILSGGGGADYLAGGLADDSYYIVSGTETLAEDAGGGRDTAYTDISYTLTAGADVEILSASAVGSTTAIHLTGNEIANGVIGNAGDNTIDGKGGGDYLAGGGGVDTFAFTTALGAGNVDTIADFQAGIDKIALDSDVFTGLVDGPLPAGAFADSSAPPELDDRIIYNSATGQIFFDADGSDPGAAVLFATVNPGTILMASDFTVI